MAGRSEVLVEAANSVLRAHRAGVPGNRANGVPARMEGQLGRLSRNRRLSGTLRRPACGVAAHIAIVVTRSTVAVTGTRATHYFPVQPSGELTADHPDFGTRCERVTPMLRPTP